MSERDRPWDESPGSCVRTHCSSGGPASEIMLGEIVRLHDGPLAPLGDAAELRRLADVDPTHPGLFSVMLDVRDAAARILDGTSLATLRARNRKILKARSGHL